MSDNILDLTTDEVTPGEEPVKTEQEIQAEVENKQQQAKNKPDTATVKRISRLAIVGTALLQRANDNSFQTDFLLADDALKDFEAGINDLDLDPESERGMHDLIAYLREKIQKRLKSNINMTALK